MRLRFSIRDLFWITLLVGVLMAWRLDYQETQRQIRDWEGKEQDWKELMSEFRTLILSSRAFHMRTHSDDGVDSDPPSAKSLSEPRIDD